MKARIKLVEPLGFCYGVRRAVKIAEKALRDNVGKKVYSLGGIIHNKDAVTQLIRKGLIVKNSLKGVKKGDVLIVSSHGTDPFVLRSAKGMGIELVNATCPNVITSQRLCEKLRMQDYFIVIIGESSHREVKSLRGFAGKKSVVIKNEREAKIKKIGGMRLGIVSQTTQSKENFTKILKEIIGGDYSELRVYNTICDDTARRQKAALDLSKKVHSILVVGGKHSANTRRLYELCKKIKPKCAYIENAGELRASHVKGAKLIGVIGGASTPDWVIKGVLEKIRCIQKSRLSRLRREKIAS